MTRGPALILLATTAAWGPACGDHAATRVPSTAAAHGGDAVPHSRRIDVAAPVERGLALGAPHAAPIEDLVLCLDGTCAVTRDSRGGVRLWPDLDADDAEPLVVPAAGAHRLAAGGPAGARTVAYIDAAGAGHVLALDRNHRWRELFATAPSDPLVQLEVLPDGDHTLALGADRVVRLYDRRGRERARLDQPGSRPGELVVAAAGDRALAVSMDGDAAVDIAAQPLTITLAPTPALVADGDELTFDDVVLPLAFSPAADAVAAFALVDGTRRVVIAALAGGGFVPLAADFDAAAASDLGFVGDRDLLVTSVAAGPAWRVSAAGATALTRPPLRFNAGGLVRVATARDRAVVAAGSWLFTQRPSRGTHAYLGYAPFQPTGGAVSADGSRAAWIANGHIYVEPTDPTAGDATVRIPALQPAAYRVAFLDNDHVMVLDGQGGLHLVDATNGRTLASADAGGTPRSFEVDPDRRRILVVPASAVPHLFHYDRDFALAGPLLAPQVTTAAGLVPDRAALWTYDGKTLRTFTTAELAAGVTQESARDRGDEVEAIGAMTGDGRGRLYGFDHTSRTVSIVGPGVGPAGAANIDVPNGVHVYRVLPSPDGTRVAVHSANQVLALYDLQGREQWARAIDRSVHDIAWSPDGALILTAGMAGAGLWRAADGSPARVRCGVWFERTPTPPLAPHVDLREAPLCE